MAASRNEHDEDCVNIFAKSESLAILLALALQEEDADRFLDVYDHVIPENLPREEIEYIKDRARELSALPRGSLASLQKQHQELVTDCAGENTQSTVLFGSVKDAHLSIVTETSCSILREIATPTSRGGVTKTVPETASPGSLPFLPKCVATAMEGATPSSAVAVSTGRNERNKPIPVLSKSENIWNNNNNIETRLVSEESVGAHIVSSCANSDDILNGNDLVNKSVDNQSQDLSNIDSSVPVGCPALTNVKIKTKSVAPFSKQELLQSALKLIDSRPRLVSSTCPKPAFVDPNRPDQVLQIRAGKTDMAAASGTPNTKKTELLVRLAPTSKNSLPNGSINNKKPSRVSPSQKVNSVPNDETPLMGNSQRTDSSVCVKQYGTNVPSSRNDHLQSSSASYNVDSDEPQDRSKLALSSGESDGIANSKPATLGEQFEASKAQESKRKKSKKKKKKAPDQEKIAQSPVAVNNDKEVFEDAFTELPPPKNPLISSDSLTSNEEFSSDTGGVSGRPTIAAKMLDGSFHVDDPKTPVKSNTDDFSGSTLAGGDSNEVVITNSVSEGDAEEAEVKKKGENTQTTQAKVSMTNLTQATTIQYKTDIKTTLKPSDVNDEILANNRKMDSSLLSMTAHSTHVQQVKETFEMKDPSFQDSEETNAGDDDGEFQEVSSRRSRRARKIKGISMEDKTYTHQSKQPDKEQLRRSCNTSGMRKSSSEPASMARLGETEPEQHSDINYLRKLPNRSTTLGINRDAFDKPAPVPPPKPNTELTCGPVMISYAGKVKAGIEKHASAQASKSSNPVKFTLDDEHSDGHVSDSSIISPQNDAPLNQRTTNSLNLDPSNSIILTKEEISIDAKVTEEVKPKQEVPLQHTGGTSPKFEISFGEFTPVYISGAPKSLKTSCDTTSEGLNMNTRPLQKVTRSNSVDGLETEGGTIGERPLSTTQQQHQEANVQYLDLQSANTYAGRLKRSLHTHSTVGLMPKVKVVEEPIQTTVRQNDQVPMEANLLPDPLKSSSENPEKKQHSTSSSDHAEMEGVEIKYNQGKSPQITPLQSISNTIAKPSLGFTRVENKSHQELKAAHVSGGITVSPTPSITSSKGASSSVCFPLNMEPMDLGITFGDVNISEVLNEESVVVRQDRPVDKIIASADAANLPQVPSTGHSCTDLETAWRRDESKDIKPPIDHLATRDCRGAENQREFMLKITTCGEAERESNIGNFNYYEVANMLMKAWTSTLEQKEANPSQVQYYSEDARI